MAVEIEQNLCTRPAAHCLDPFQIRLPGHVKAAQAYDVVEPLPELYDDLPAKDEIRCSFLDIRNVPPDSRYGRILTIAAMEHVEELPECIARAALLLEEGGMLQVSIPSEGGFLWGASWRLTTGLLFRWRTGLNYAPFMRFEHINTADDVARVIDCFFREVEIRRFPFPFRHLSFYTYIEAHAPKRDACQTYLREHRQRMTDD